MVLLSEATAADFRIVSELGAGGFGMVYKVTSPLTDAVFALKKIPLSGLTVAQQRKAVKEAMTQGRISHPNIITYSSELISKG